MTKVTATALVSLRIAALATFIAVPATSEASIASLVASFFSVQAATPEEMPATNSQKMALLEAPINSNGNAGVVGDIAVEGSALVADATASGAMGLPLSSNTISTYTVKAGDTVSEIAEKFGISSNTILWSNNLKRTSTLTVGQTLVILPISGVQHKVVAGDTVQSIAKKYKGDVDEIMSYNNINNGKLNIGDIVVVPDGEMTPAATPATSKTGSVSRPKLTTTAFGYYMRPILAGIRTQGVHGNNGVDLADSCGTPIYAAASGNVIVSTYNNGWNGGYGNYVVINHANGSQTLYAHMQQVFAKLGSTVTKGQQIGLIGATGKVRGVTGCHLHFEIRNGPYNPF